MNLYLLGVLPSNYTRQLVCRPNIDSSEKVLVFAHNFDGVGSAVGLSVRFPDEFGAYWELDGLATFVSHLKTCKIIAIRCIILR